MVGIDQIAPERPQACQRPLLVGTGKLAVSGYIRRKNGCKFSGLCHGSPFTTRRLARLAIGLDTLFRLDDHCSYEGLAAEPWPRTTPFAL